MGHNVVVTGVGGQGVLLAARVLGEAALAAGHDPIVGEQHGMSQRGGSVIAHVRYGSDVYAPMVPKGHADVVIGLEPMEALRYSSYLGEAGTVISETEAEPPLSVTEGRESYPEESTLEAALGRRGALLRVEANELAREAGNRRAANVVLLGAASRVCDLDIDVEHIRDAIASAVPDSAREANRTAFDRGREAVDDFRHEG
ncbi:MAG: indolepyruvate oxidoreductase subunit beta [Halodesulfurarchaeum sp.]